MPEIANGHVWNPPAWVGPSALDPLQPDPGRLPQAIMERAFGPEAIAKCGSTYRNYALTRPAGSVAAALPLAARLSCQATSMGAATAIEE